MKGETQRTPVQVRLPEWARDFLNSRARERGETKSDVVIEALDCLRQQEIDALMADGYRALGEAHTELVEAGLAASHPTIPR